MLHLLRAALMLAMAMPVYAADLINGKFVDLTHDFAEDAIYWPTAEPFQLETVYKGMTDAGFYYVSYNYRASEHGGTHLDSPIHFAEARKTVEQIPIEQLIGPGAVINIAEQAAADRNYQLSVEDIKAWEAENGMIPDGAILLIDTGSSKLWPDRKAYMGTDERGPQAVKNLKFPGIHPDAAQFLADERKIGAVGIDTPSIDYGGSRLFKAHQILYKQNIPGLENVANLDQLPPTGTTIIALPMKIRGGSGAPLRIIALMP